MLAVHRLYAARTALGQPVARCHAEKRPIAGPRFAGATDEAQSRACTLTDSREHPRRRDGTLDLESKLDARTLTVGVIGLGYVGLPPTHAFWQAGLKVLGFDIDTAKVEKLSAGGSYINHFAPTIASGRFRATADSRREKYFP